MKVQQDAAIQEAIGAIASRRDDLVELASALIRFDTTARYLNEPPHDDAALQAFLAERRTSAGAAVDRCEPDPTYVAAIRWTWPLDA